MTFPPHAVFKDQVLRAELDPQHDPDDPDALTTGLQANEVGRVKAGRRRPSVLPTTPCADAFALHHLARR